MKVVNQLSTNNLKTLKRVERGGRFASWEKKVNNRMSKSTQSGNPPSGTHLVYGFT